MDKKTVFVIGAGASKEVNLPTGEELKGKIKELLNIRFDDDKQTHGDNIIALALREHVKLPDGRSGDINPYLSEAWHIRDALPLAISIDNFIDSQRGNEKLALCGKLAITRSILREEGNSLLFFERGRELDFGGLRDAWYIPFFQLLTENCHKSDLKKRFESVVLIIFNYDRCVQHFMYHALRTYYKLSREEAAEFISGIKIFHPYGKVGSLPWESGRESSDFGYVPSGAKLLALSKDIRTFTEGTDPDSSEILVIREYMSTARRLVFLGFSYHPLNMQLIKPDWNPDLKLPAFYATARGISDSDQNVVRRELKKLYYSEGSPIGLDLFLTMGGPCEVSGLDCKELFSTYWRSLSFVMTV